MARGAWLGAALLGLLNFAFGLAPGWWLGGCESSINQLYELDRRVEGHPRPEAVKVLVLGNSHAQTGLRPQALAAALGLAPEAVFSLALPAANPLESRLLVERYAARFPHVALAVGNVDVAYMNQQQEARLRYLTRHSPAGRWRWAAAEPNLDARLGLMLGLALPLFDFKEPLRKRFEPGPSGALSSAEGRRLLAEIDYPWGYPILFEHPALFTAVDRHRLQSRHELLQRALALTPSPERLEAHKQALEALEASLKGRGIPLKLVELPLPTPMASALAVRAKPVMRRYAAALAATGLQVIKAPAIPELARYHDGDHLDAEGARRVAASLAAEAGLRQLLDR